MQCKVACHYDTIEYTSSLCRQRSFVHTSLNAMSTQSKQKIIFRYHCLSFCYYYTLLFVKHFVIVIAL